MERGLPKSSDKAWNSKSSANPRHKRHGSAGLQGSSNPLLHSPNLQVRTKGRGTLLQLGSAKGRQSGAQTPPPQTSQHTDRYSQTHLNPGPQGLSDLRRGTRHLTHCLVLASHTHTHPPLHMLLVRTLGATHIFGHPWTPRASVPLPSSGLGDLGPGAPAWRLLFRSSHFQQLPSTCAAA